MHAAVLFEEGEAFLTAFETGVRFSYQERKGYSARASEPKELAPQELVPMIPGLTWTLGGCEVVVDEVSEADFKGV